jgi:hypothetical protein
VDLSSGKVYCRSHARAEDVGGLYLVSRLEQYIFLLHCALVRLCGVLDVSGTFLLQLFAALINWCVVL